MIVDPSPGDLARIRREAIDAAVASGAAPERVEVVIEVDTARNRVRATASGATALVEGAQLPVVADEAAQLAAAATHLRVRAEDARVVARTDALVVIASARESAVVDARGVVRLVLPGAFVYRTLAAGVDRNPRQSDRRAHDVRRRRAQPPRRVPVARRPHRRVRRDGRSGADRRAAARRAHRPRRRRGDRASHRPQARVAQAPACSPGGGMGAKPRRFRDARLRRPGGRRRERGLRGCARRRPQRGRACSWSSATAFLGGTATASMVGRG